MAYHNYPNNKNYGTYYGDDEPVWPAILVIIGLLGIFFLFAYYSGPLGDWFRKHSKAQITFYLVAGGFGILILSSVVWAVTSEVLKWWDSLFAGYNTYPKEPYKPGSTVKNTNNTSYLVPKPKNTMYDYNKVKGTTILPSEREKPPRAEFFGRLEGKSLHAKGLYEEKWLNIHEYNYWIEQKAREEARKAGLLDKKVVRDLLDFNTTTKVDF